MLNKLVIDLGGKVMYRQKQNVSKEQQALIDAGGDINSFYDVFEALTDEELERYKFFSGIKEMSLEEKNALIKELSES